MTQKEFAKFLKDKLDQGIQNEIGEFSTYLLEVVAACKQGGSELFTKAEATDIMAFVAQLSNSTGESELQKPDNIHDAFPELMEFVGIMATIKTAMLTESAIEANMLKRYFYLAGRVMNFITSQIEEAGV